MNGFCKFLDWDSEHFKKRIAQVNKPVLYRSDFEKVDHWCNTNKIDCVYYLKDSLKASESGIEESNNFRLVDNRVELYYKIDDIPITLQNRSDIKISFQSNRIRNELITISDRNINNTRFYNDINFCSDLVKKMYQIWIKKSCEDPFTNVLIAEYKNKIIGFITFTIGHEAIGNIGLVAIDKNHQRLGIGKSIMKECIHACYKQKQNRVLVATQLNNQPAIKFYEGIGFKVLSKSNWYHKWYT